MSRSNRLLLYRDLPYSLTTIVSLELARKPHLLKLYDNIPTDLADLIAQAFKQRAFDEKMNEYQCKQLYKYLDPDIMPLSKIDFTDLPISAEFIINFLNEHQQLKVIDIDVLRLLKWGPEWQEKIIKRFQDYKGTRVGLYWRPGGDWPKSYHIASSSFLKSNFDKFTICFEGAYTHINDMWDGQLSHYIGIGYNYTLRHLDLSESFIPKGTDFGQLMRVESLILFNSPIDDNTLSSIYRLKNLKILDLSQFVNEYYFIDITVDANKLERLITELPKLEQLDISGFHKHKMSGQQLSFALRTRSNMPLNFLGIFGVSNDRVKLPGKKVASSINGEEFMNALEANIMREKQVEYMMDKLNLEFEFNIVRVLYLAIDILNHCKSAERIWPKLYMIISNNLDDKHSGLRKVLIKAIVQFYEYQGRMTISLSKLYLLPEFSDEIYCEILDVSLRICIQHKLYRNTNCDEQLNFLAQRMNSQNNFDQETRNAKKQAIGERFLEKIFNCCMTVGKTQPWIRELLLILYYLTHECPTNCEKLASQTNFLKLMTEWFEYIPYIHIIGNIAESELLKQYLMYDDFLNDIISKSLDKHYDHRLSTNRILAHLACTNEAFWNEHSSIQMRQKVLDCLKQSRLMGPITATDFCYQAVSTTLIHNQRLLDPSVSAEVQYVGLLLLESAVVKNRRDVYRLFHKEHVTDSLHRLIHSEATETFVQDLASKCLIRYNDYKLFSRKRENDTIDNFEMQ